MVTNTQTIDSVLNSILPVDLALNFTPPASGI